MERLSTEGNKGTNNVLEYMIKELSFINDL